MDDALNTSSNKELEKKSLINLSEKTTKGTEYSSSTSFKEGRLDRTDSKISTKITQSILEHEKKYLKNPDDYDRIKEDESDDSIIKTEGNEIVVNEPIKVNILIPETNNDIKKFILVRITNKVTISDLIKLSVEMFNDLFYNEKMPYILNCDSKDFHIRPCKKSGKPDYDLPKIAVNNLVCETNMKSFSLIFDNKDIIHLKRREGFLEKCKSCLIF